MLKVIKTRSLNTLTMQSKICLGVKYLVTLFRISPSIGFKIPMNEQQPLKGLKCGSDLETWLELTHSFSESGNALLTFSQSHCTSALVEEEVPIQIFLCRKPISIDNSFRRLLLAKWSRWMNVQIPQVLLHYNLRYILKAYLWQECNCHHLILSHRVSRGRFPKFAAM